MRKLSVICFVVLAASYHTFARWALVSLSELVNESDLIVIGTLQSVSEYSKEETDYGEGTILIEKVLSGNVKTVDGFPLKAGDEIRLKWQNRSMIACPRVEHKGSENKKEVWLLTVEPDKTVRADYPGRSVALDNLAEVKQYLRKSPKGAAKTVSTQKETEQISQSSSVKPTFAPVNLLSYSEQSEEKGNSFVQALLVILASISLYYFLYRSRFRIR